jgi:hypothetical protein
MSAQVSGPPAAQAAQIARAAELLTGEDRDLLGLLHRRFADSLTIAAYELID